MGSAARLFLDLGVLLLISALGFGLAWVQERGNDCMLLLVLAMILRMLARWTRILSSLD
jgi:hypothetical protein